MLLIIAHLGAAVGVWKRGDLIDLFRKIHLGLPFDGGCHVIDTAYGRDDPDIVADADFAVRPPVALEKYGLRRRDRSALPVIGIGEHIPQPCPQIVGMDPCACRHRLFGKSDGASVLDHLPALREICQSKLMPLWYVFGQYNGL